MYAGYDYSFFIQGRDEYHNNIVDLVENAVGGDYSILYTLISDIKVTFDAKITDYSAAGVFVVKVTLPKKLQAGNYDLRILLRGADAPSSVILVRPCTNTIAFDLGILPAAGNTF